MLTEEQLKAMYNEVKSVARRHNLYEDRFVALGMAVQDGKLTLYRTVERKTKPEGGRRYEDTWQPCYSNTASIRSYLEAMTTKERVGQWRHKHLFCGLVPTGYEYIEDGVKYKVEYVFKEEKGNAD